MVMLSHINMPDAGSPTGKIEVLHFPPKKKKKNEFQKLCIKLFHRLSIYSGTQKLKQLPSSRFLVSFFFLWKQHVNAD